MEKWCGQYGIHANFFFILFISISQLFSILEIREKLTVK